MSQFFTDAAVNPFLWSGLAAGLLASISCGIVGPYAVTRRLLFLAGALAHIADELAPRAQNVHLRDHLEEGKMKFDYKLRPGVVEHSNAIELMRSVGLDV